VIITGGAVGSVLGQLLPMTSSERTVLMVAGASAGMAATFNCPMSATLLAVEILLFEWKPRSLGAGCDCLCNGWRGSPIAAGAEIVCCRWFPPVRPVYHSAMLGALVLGIIAAFVAAA
jgi:CIC family chloride channel protein